MLLVALLLLLAAVGLLATSFVTSATWWAWASIAVSGLAAAEPGAAPAPAVEESVPGDGAATVPSDRVLPSNGAPSDGAPLDGTEPAEEETDAADLLVVCE